MNINEFAAMVVKNCTGPWTNGTFDVEGIGPVGIKASGKWIQRMEWCGVRDGGEFRTQKAMRQWIIESLERYR